jgi:hypothetical protein
MFIFIHIHAIKMKNTTVITFDQLLDRKYGKRGSVERESWEIEFEIFKAEVLSEQEKKPLKEVLLQLKAS